MNLQKNRVRFAFMTCMAMTLMGLTGCQKKCDTQLDWGWMKLGMYDSYKPGPSSLLDDTLFQYKGPAYPQQSIAARINASLLGQFTIGSQAKPLRTFLEKQHFTCARTATGSNCHLTITVSRQERCNVFEHTRHYQFQETFDIAIEEDIGRIKNISTAHHLT